MKSNLVLIVPESGLFTGHKCLYHVDTYIHICKAWAGNVKAEYHLKNYGD